MSVRFPAPRPRAVIGLTLAALVLCSLLPARDPAFAQGMIEGARTIRAATPRTKSATATARSSRSAVAPPFYTGKPDVSAFRARADGELKQAQSAIDRMLAVRGPRTIENTVAVYNEAMMHGENVAYQSHLLEAVHPDSSFRSAAESISQVSNKFLDDLSLNRAVYDALVSVDASKADAGTRYFMMRTLRDFRRAGVDKDEATRKQMAAIYEELVKTGQDFDRNIRTDSRKIQVSASDLDGLPEDFRKAHAPGSDGKVTLSIETPDYVPVVRYAKSNDVRKSLMHEAMNRAYPANIAVLDSLLVKRYRVARMLGYDTWADYITEDKMIGTAKNAADFITRLNDTTLKRAQEEYAVYLKRKQEDDPSATQVNRWEVSYYGRLIRKRDFDFDPQEVRPYFPFDQVRQGVLDVTSKMFGVTYKKIANAPVWDASVDAYEVYQGPKLIGRFYFDLHPRPGKFNHAAKFTIRQGTKGFQLPEHALVCNFSGGKPGDPGLMEHSEVQTFFHEFGHLLHAIFGGQGRWEPVAGTATERDFVEAPSQMLEEWVWDPNVLRTFAKHYKTGEPIPVELVKKMRRADAFGRALQIATQGFYSAVSLNIYNRPPSEVVTDRVVADLEPRFTPVPPMPDSHMQTSFGHLDGYSAVYYTYMWSLVISKDMFSAFNKSNLLDPTVATRYRDIVLAPGGTRPARDMVHDFLGRDYDFRQFDAWLGGKE
ncbi:MAG TPA: M3 family metallopeptidase [Candidatus Limnocylindrales bacterium]|nr:M3 family metallopeptidase [Candidatus Limnocylindrales bacterium]